MKKNSKNLDFIANNHHLAKALEFEKIKLIISLKVENITGETQGHHHVKKR